MQVYKAFFRILNKQKGQIIMYLAIFFGIAMTISMQTEKNNSKKFEKTSYSIVIFDEDKTAVSQDLTKALLVGNERVEIEDKHEVIQDEIYNRNINCVIRIPKGYEESLTNKEMREVEILSVPGTMVSETFKNLINKQVTLIKSYIAAGFPLNEAIQKVALATKEGVSVELTEDGDSSSYSGLYYFFLYVPYIMLSMIIVGIAPILIVFWRKEVQDRNRCSSYSLTRTNVQLFAGVMTTGLVFGLIYCLMVIAGTGTAIFSFQGYLHCLNMLCFVGVSLGIVFLLGQIIKKTTAINMVSNVFALGMSFLCGVFVPLEFLGDTIIRVVHFLPAYWYVRSITFIENYVPGKDLGELWMGLGIELLFGAAALCMGLAYSRVKRTNA